MRKLTDLLFLTILFAKFSMFSSFILHFLANIEEIHPHLIFQWSKGIISHTIQYVGKLFTADEGQIVLGKFIGGLFYMES